MAVFNACHLCLLPCRDRATSYVIDGQQVDGIFACDLTLAEVQQLRAMQRWAFRDHSFDGQYGVVTFDIFLDLALAANRPVGIYPGELHISTPGLVSGGRSP